MLLALRHIVHRARALLGASLGTLLTGTRAIFGASFCGGTLLTGTNNVGASRFLRLRSA